MFKDKPTVLVSTAFATFCCSIYGFHVQKLKLGLFRQTREKEKQWYVASGGPSY